MFAIETVYKKRREAHGGTALQNLELIRGGKFWKITR